MLKCTKKSCKLLNALWRYGQPNVYLVYPTIVTKKQQLQRLILTDHTNYKRHNRDFMHALLFAGTIISVFVWPAFSPKLLQLSQVQKKWNFGNNWGGNFTGWVISPLPQPTTSKHWRKLYRHCVWKQYTGNKHFHTCFLDCTSDRPVGIGLWDDISIGLNKHDQIFSHTVYINIYITLVTLIRVSTITRNIQSNKPHNVRMFKIFK